MANAPAGERLTALGYPCQLCVAVLPQAPRASRRTPRNPSECIQLERRTPAPLSNPWRGLWDSVSWRHLLPGRGPTSAAFPFSSALRRALSVRIQLHGRLEVGHSAGASSAL